MGKVNGDAEVGRMNETDDESVVSIALAFLKALLFLIVVGLLLPISGLVGIFGMMLLVAVMPGTSNSYHGLSGGLVMLSFTGGVIASCFLIPRIFRSFYKQ